MRRDRWLQFLAFLVCAVVGAIAAALAFAWLGETNEYGRASVFNRAWQITMAAMACLPVVATAGLIVALPIDRLFLRYRGIGPYILTTILAGLGAPFILEAILFGGSDYPMTDSFILPGFAAAVSAAGVWWILIRKREFQDDG